MAIRRMERDDEKEEDKERTQTADGERVCVRRIERGQKKYRKEGWKKDEEKE